MREPDRTRVPRCLERVEKGPWRALPSAPLPGVFTGRVNRFVAEITLDGVDQRVHVPNSGRLTQLAVPGTPCMVLEASAPGRKTRFDWILARAPGGGWAVVDARVPGDLLYDALRTAALAEFGSPTEVRREVRRGASRLDFLLSDSQGAQCWIEVKSVTLALPSPWGMEGRFPDAPTTRGVRHLRELTAAREAGNRAVVVFAVGRPDARSVGPNVDVDPDFSRALWSAASAGVEILAYRVDADPVRGYRLGGRIPVHLPRFEDVR